jgi:hypothetical protein
MNSPANTAALWTSLGLPIPSVDEVSYKSKKKKQVLYLSHYLDREERRDVIKDTGEPGCLLLEYYLRCAGPGQSEITDEQTAKYFGWTKQKAQDYRLRLTKAGYYKSELFRSARGRKAIIYYIGKEAVRGHGGP